MRNSRCPARNVNNTFLINKISHTPDLGVSTLLMYTDLTHNKLTVFSQQFIYSTIVTKGKYRTKQTPYHMYVNN